MKWIGLDNRQHKHIKTKTGKMKMLKLNFISWIEKKMYINEIDIRCSIYLVDNECMYWKSAHLTDACKYKSAVGNRQVCMC